MFITCFLTSPVPFNFHHLHNNIYEHFHQTHVLLQAEGSCVGDVIFVLDSSGSIGFLNWSVSAQFVLDVMQKLKISQEGTHVGVVIYSTNVETSFGLNTYFSVAEIEPVMLNLFYMAGVTNTADGIKTMHEIMNAQGNILYN